jgi:hypothetical protein
MIELSPATDNSGIVYGPGGLRERRISDRSRYGRLPATVSERTVLVKRLSTLVGCEADKVISFAGIPGFWRDAAGEWLLWTKFDSSDELLLIPIVGPDGLIQACQIRYMQHLHGQSGNYVWLSSGKERMGASPGSPLHHAGPGVNFDKPVLVTEGALKAATAQRFLADRYVVGNSGVATAHKEIVETAREKPLEIAFDNDSFSNPHVARALASLVARRLSDRRLHGYDDEVHILTWDKSLKGIDEAVSKGASINYLTISKWLQQLSPACFEQAAARLSLTHEKEAVGSGCNELLQSSDRHSPCG